mgnify:CR=1 FL=1
MDFVEPVAVRLLRVGQPSVGPEHMDLLRRLLSVKKEHGRLLVLQVIGVHGSVACVPALRELDGRPGRDANKVRALLVRTISHLQSRCGGQAGTLAMVDGLGGQLAVAPPSDD